MPSRIDLIVLGLLVDRPMHGYEVHQTLISDEMSQWVDIGFTSIYHALSRLKKNGLVVETVDKASNKQKNVYHLTPRGRETFFEDLRTALAEQSKLILDYNIPLYFLNKLNPGEAAAALNIRSSFLKNWIATLDNTPMEGDRGATIRMIIEHTKAIATKEIEYLQALTSCVEGDSITCPPERSTSLMSVRGNLKERALTDVVRFVAAGGRTGTLKIEHGNHLCAISFNEGSPVQVMSSDMPVVKVSGKDEDLQVDGNLALQVLSNVYEAFSYRDGSFEFDPNEPIESGGIPVDLSVDNLILEGCRRVDDWEKIRAVVPSDDSIFDLDDALVNPDVLTKFLSDRERAVYDSVNGVRDVHAVAELCKLSVFETSKILYALSVSGLVLLVNADKAEVMKLFREYTRTLLEQVYTIAGDVVVAEIEKEANLEAEGQALPFLCKNGSLDERLLPGTGLTDLIQTGHKFLSLLAKVVSSHIGKRFTTNLLDNIIKRLPPRMAEDFERYGLDDISNLIEAAKV